MYPWRTHLNESHPMTMTMGVGLFLSNSHENQDTSA